MIKSTTSFDLKELDITPSNEWLQNPINVGSVYIKPTEDKTTCCKQMFMFCWYCCCWIYYD